MLFTNATNGTTSQPIKDIILKFERNKLVTFFIKLTLSDLRKEKKQNFCGEVYKCTCVHMSHCLPMCNEVCIQPCDIIQTGIGRLGIIEALQDDVMFIFNFTQ